MPPADPTLLLPRRHGPAALLSMPGKLEVGSVPGLPCTYVLAVQAGGRATGEALALLREAIPMLLGGGGEGDRVAVVLLDEAGSAVAVRPTGSAEGARRALLRVGSGRREPARSGLWPAVQLAVSEATRRESPLPVLAILAGGPGAAGASALGPARRAAAMNLPALVIALEDGARGASGHARLARALRAPLLLIAEPSPWLLAAALLEAAARAARDPRWRPPPRVNRGGSSPG